MRLINADHLLNEIEALKKSPWFNNGSDSFDPLVRGRHLAINETVGMVVDLCIKQEPTVEPKRGRWVLEEETSLDYSEPIYLCSVCNNYEAWGKTECTKYCPNCGARMEGETDV